jgi:ADP-ribose pyrophosphatase YjhB (NUDIX family)
MYEYTYCPVCAAKLEEKILDGRMRKCCPECDFVYYNNPLPSAGAIAIKGDEILLIKRGEEPARGIWAPPSGFIESGESPEEACLRELKEETGANGILRELLGVYHHHSGIYGDVLVIMYLVTDLSGDLRPGDDAEDVKFFPLKEITNLTFNCYNEAFKKALNR